MKAYIVTDEYGEGGACVRFADHNVVARREGANELNCEFDGVSCRRYPEFDEYAADGVPGEVMIAHGWRYECMHCGRQVAEEMYDDDDEPIDLMPVFVGAHVYCSSDCRTKFLAERKAETDRADAAAAEAMKRWPGIDIKQKNGYEQPARVWFTFPGGDFHQCHWIVGSETLLVPQIAVDAWHKFAAEVKAKQPVSELDSHES